MNNTTTLIDLIRHGEPVGGRRYRGHTIDDPLTEKGWSQMWTAVGNQQRWQQIITSPLQRCHAFAQALGEKQDVDVTIEPRFKEVGFGVWEGCSHDEIKLNQIAEYQAFLRDPVRHRPQGAEVLDGFIQRVNNAFNETVARFQGEHCLIVAHAGVIRAIVAQIVHAEPIGLYRIKVSNGGITRIRHTAAHGTLEFLNGKLTDAD